MARNMGHNMAHNMGHIHKTENEIMNDKAKEIQISISKYLSYHLGWRHRLSNY